MLHIRRQLFTKKLAFPIVVGLNLLGSSVDQRQFQTALTPATDPGVTQYPEQPRATVRRRVEGLKILPGSKKRLLNQIVRRLRTHKLSCHPVDRRQMRQSVAFEVLHPWCLSEEQRISLTSNNLRAAPIYSFFCCRS